MTGITGFIPSRNRWFLSLNCLDQLQDLPCILLS